MCRRLDAIMPNARMGAGWGDSDKCGWIITEIKSPEGFTIGEASVQKQQELRILGCLCAPKDTEERLVEDRVNNAWKTFWANRAALQNVGISHRLRVRLLDTTVKPVLMWGTSCIDPTRSVRERIRLSQ